MNVIEKLKELEAKATPRCPLWMISVTGPDQDIERQEDRDLLETLRTLAPEFIGVWAASQAVGAKYNHLLAFEGSEESQEYQAILDEFSLLWEFFALKLNTLNRKAAEVLA
jgi:hypothetical protein